MQPEASLLDILQRQQRNRRIDWRDIAEMVGARREDFERVRHAAKWQQENLPRMRAEGNF